MKEVTVVDQLYPGSDDVDKNLARIKGKTLEVYYFLARALGEKYGVRQIQRELNYSSPSVAAYHLNRLVNQNLIKKTASGLYYLEGEPIKLGRLEDHILIAGKYIPRIAFYLYHSILSILVAFGFLFFKVHVMVWFVYMVLSNAIFIGILLRDSKNMLNKIEVGNLEDG